MDTWVLLRGLIREQRHWGGFVQQFHQAFPDVQIITLDIPGNGVLHHQTSPASVHGMVQACRKQLHEQGLKGPYRVLALSMGAMVAAQWATDYPEEIKSQVFINTSMRPLSPFYHRLRPRNYLRLVRNLVSGAPAEQWESSILKMTTTYPHPEVLKDWVAWRVQCPVTPQNALRQLFAAARFRLQAMPPTVPTLVLASTLDRLVSVECSKRLARTLRAEIFQHPVAGHDLPLDDGTWVIERVREWLALS
jgi:pimeloyl-ACP methyl ester carboxylesterase